MPARASLSGFAVPYNVLISLTCDFALGTCFHVVYARHLALKGLTLCL